MNAEDTKKAMKCCMKTFPLCHGCPLKDTCITGQRKPLKKAFELIEHYEAKIERLEKGSLEAAMTFNSKTIANVKAEAIKEFEEKSEKILIELYEKYHKIANKPKKETDMFYLFYQGRAEAIWECITANRNLVKEMTEGNY